jgi:hypothetical protein
MFAVGWGKQNYKYYLHGFQVSKCYTLANIMK